MIGKEPARRGAAPSWCALVVVVGALAYLPGLHGQFVYDDHRLIVENEGLKRPLDLRRAFLRDYYSSDLDPIGLGYYRPVAILSNEMDFRRGGGSPLPFHLTNILIHAACSGLVFALAFTLLDGRWALGGAAAAGLLFAVHPSHAESVAFISGRVDPLATLFSLPAILLHLRANRSPRPWPWRAPGAAFWLLALLSKEIAVTVPVLILLVETAREGLPRRREIASRLARYVPHVIVFVAYALMRWRALGAFVGPPTGATVVSLGRIPTALGSYLAWLVLPPPGLHLEPAPGTGIRAVLAAVFLAAVVVGGIWLARLGERTAAAMVGWCFVSLLPVAQLRPIETEMSERFLYLPSVGACVLAGMLLAKAGGTRMRVPAVGALAMLTVSYAAILVPRVVTWADPVRLWRAKAAEEPSSLKAYLNLGLELVTRGDVEGARAAFDRAVQLKPEMAPLAAAALPSAAGTGEGVDEVETLRRGLDADPSNATLWHNLGFHLLHKGEFQGAADAFQRSIASVPKRSTAWLGLALASQGLGDWDGAAQSAQRALALNPDLPLAKLLLSECALRANAPCDALRLAEGLVFDEPGERQIRDRVVEVARKHCPGGLSR